MDHTPERPTRREHVNFALASDENSSPLRSPRRSDRVKKNPSVTPKRFNKFFTPRPRNAQRLANASRRILQDLSAARLNTRAGGTSRLNLEISGQSEVPNKKRKLSFTSIASLPSSPIRKHHEHDDEGEGQVERHEKRDGSEEACDTADEADELKSRLPTTSRPRITPYRSISTTARYLSRQLGVKARTMEADDSTLWQHETAHFYSNPEDSCYYHNSVQRFSSLPFCVASFKQSPLVAVGDEDGHVRVHMTYDNHPHYNYTEIIKSWRPHSNAVMDLELSDDDRLIATASGDQSTHIYDLGAGKSVYFLRTHQGSVKRVQFQPGSGNQILATCSRDGHVFIWDRRISVLDGPGLSYRPKHRHWGSWSDVTFVDPVNEILQAHTSADKLKRPKGRRHPGTLPSRHDYAVTTCAFLGASRPHLLATASENDAIIKLWDARVVYHDQDGRPTPVSATLEPDSHQNHRQFGVTSIAMSTDGSRLYAACRDHTVYAYSTPHLILGSTPELSTYSISSSKFTRTPKPGLGPLYGFRHSSLTIASFYDKLAVRPASSTDNNTEMIAVGSGQECAVIFPTNERYLNNGTRRPPVASWLRLSQEAAEDLPIYENGTALVNGHKKEVTAVAWTTNGNLVTVADDHTSRCWRQDPETARALRLNTDLEVERHNSGWAQVNPGFDDDC
ncbi:uncharacterized protein A1O9_08507 [Exophiala aquamarina CBS 119918]|uniref:Uncharacterized protein n=1 Tax=Exophiala aquamarina CBS 119918 TaxID=1182545 RepID=A0A072P7H0_9EURO|nr:uncharacterized protein A1O9_08507 [Exophiala aquamarina CBS 119918]KEF55756.1 hypothetical protein A1O9_08507 [Exophiala aquamarina CBS 119918]